MRKEDPTTVNPFGMVDVSVKDEIPRSAEAVGRIQLKRSTIDVIRRGEVKKGDPLSAAEIAAILAVKRTPELIPMCHNIPLSSIDVTFSLGLDYVDVHCRVTATYRTGVEMEALTGVTVALLTIWDMIKYMEKDENGKYPSTIITDIRVTEKSKG